MLYLHNNTVKPFRTHDMKLLYLTCLQITNKNCDNKMKFKFNQMTLFLTTHAIFQSVKFY